MGLNSRHSLANSALSRQATQQREAAEVELRARVRDGSLTLDTYLLRHKGYRPEDLPRIRARFEAAIFG